MISDFNGRVSDVNDRLIIHDDELLKRFKQLSTRVLNRRVSGEVPPFVDEIIGTQGYVLNLQTEEKSSRPPMYSNGAKSAGLTISSHGYRPCIFNEALGHEIFRRG